MDNTSFNNFLKSPTKETAKELDKSDVELLIAVSEQINIDKSDMIIQDEVSSNILTLNFAQRILRFIVSFVNNKSYIPETVNSIPEYSLTLQNLDKEIEVDPLTVRNLKVLNFADISYFCDICIEQELNNSENENNTDEIRNFYLGTASNILNKFQKLVKLELGENFVGEVYGLDLPDLKYLEAGQFVGKLHDCNLPNLEHLCIENLEILNFNYPETSLGQIYFPNLIRLEIYYPEQQQEHIFCENYHNPNLIIEDQFNDVLDVKRPFRVSEILNNYPSIKHLSITSPLDNDIDLEGLYLPNLIRLELNGNFNQSISTVNLPMLEYLELHNMSEENINKINFPNLTCLVLGHGFNGPIEGIIVPKLEYLEISESFKQELPKEILDNISCLRIDKANYGDIPQKYKTEGVLDIVYKYYPLNKKTNMEIHDFSK